MDKTTKTNSLDQTPDFCSNLTPAKFLVIIGLLSGALNLDSLLLDKNQVIQIILAGSLKGEPTDDVVASQWKKMPFEQMVRNVFQ